MARKPAPARKKAERKEVNRILSTLTSPYNIMIPLFAAEHVWLTHPVTRELRHLSTRSEEFLAVMADLFEIGVGERVLRELNEFAANIDPSWTAVADKVISHVGYQPPTENTETADA